VSYFNIDYHMKKSSIILLTIFFAASCAKTKVPLATGDPHSDLERCLVLAEKKKFDEAVECLEVFKSHFPQTEEAINAELLIADNYFAKKEYLLAADTYLLFIKTHPSHPKLGYAYFRLGLSYLKASPKAIDRDQEYLDDAAYYLKIALSELEGGEYREAALRALDETIRRLSAREYYIGNFYYRTGEYIAAIPRFIELLNTYPDSKLVPNALYKLVVAHGKLKRVSDAKSFYSKLSTDYPTSPWTKRAEKKLLYYTKKYGE